MTETFDFDKLFKELPSNSLLRIDQVATFLGTTKRTVYNWYPEILDGTNLNGTIRIYRTSVVAFVIKNHGKKRSDESIPEIENKVKKPAKAKISPKKSSWIRNFTQNR